MPLRFSHKQHILKEDISCPTCHARALTSEKGADRLLPNARVCDACHLTDHRDLTHVTPGEEAIGACTVCHEGAEGERGIRPVFVPTPNLVFSHKKHVDRNIGCAKCHGDMTTVDLATREHLPRMQSCLGCHQRPDHASQGEAKAACDTCHLKSPGGAGGRILTTFAEGSLKPPAWMLGAAHTPDFIDRHKAVAASDSGFCANCHKEDFCTDCHDGRVRPRSIHPSDYVSMHPIEARQVASKCTSCHREQSFCLGCHMRLGVSMGGPAGVREAARFHPPKAIFSDPPRRPGHHAFEAQRNLNACVSCHTERDCTVCHGARGIGGAVSPHRNFSGSRCQAEYQKNPRPCFVCHHPDDALLDRCR